MILGREAEAVRQHRRVRGTKLGERRVQRRAELLQRRLRSVALLVYLLDPPLPDQVGEQRSHWRVRKFPYKLGDRGNLPAGGFQTTGEQAPGVRGPGVQCRWPPPGAGAPAGHLPYLLARAEIQDLVDDGWGRS